MGLFEFIKNKLGFGIVSKHDDHPTIIIERTSWTGQDFEFLI